MLLFTKSNLSQNIYKTIVEINTDYYLNSKMEND